MKKSKLILILLIAFVGYSCHEDETLQQGKVQFSFNSVSAAKTGGRKQTDVIPDGSALLISISKSNGDSVFTMKKIDLIKIGDAFVSIPLALPQGNYILKDFLVVGANDVILFAAPKTGSILATLVTTPLPVPFSVNVNAIANTDVEVVNANYQQPQDFGYASFDLKIVPSSGISVSTFVVEDGKANFTSAQAYILHGADTVLSKEITAAVNNLYWETTPGEHYTLSIIKDSYARYTKQFTIDSISAALQGKPLAVVLAPAMTIRWSLDSIGADRSVYPFRLAPTMVLSATAGSKVSIDWGDGIVQNIQFQTNAYIQIKHTYLVTKKYFASVSGDLASITGLDFGARTAKFHSFSITNLTGLTQLRMADLDLSIDIDISHNTKLSSLELQFNRHLHSLDISHNPLLTYIDITSLALSTPTVDKVIDDLWASATASNRRNGTFNMQSDYFALTPVGPPSAPQLSKLHGLVDALGWTVSPGNF